MEIAEFLLARIAEDEERGRSLVAQWYDVGNACQSCGTDGARVLAECEAKRTIVNEAVAVLSAVGQAGWSVSNEGLRSRARRLLKLLALPYADHPDYDPAWKM